MHQYQQRQVLELAYAAKRKNGEYVKQRTFLDDGTVVYTNRDLIHKTLNGLTGESDFTMLSITDTDQNNALDADKVFKKFSLLVLGERLSTFEKSIYTAYCKAELSDADLGLFAYLPYFVENKLAVQALKIDAKSQCNTFEFVTEHRVDGMVNVISKRFIQDWQKFSYDAVYDGKLVSFFSQLDLALQKDYHITAKVKDRKIHRSLEVPSTQLNYVKVKTK
jgi:hypothetical protein